MRRFDYDDNDDGDDFFEEAENILNADDYKKLVEEDQAIQRAQIETVNRELNRKLLVRSITFCEKYFLWNFLSLESQLNRIEKAYLSLKKIEEKDATL